MYALYKNSGWFAENCTIKCRKEMLWFNYDMPSASKCTESHGCHEVHSVPPPFLLPCCFCMAKHTLEPKYMSETSDTINQKTPLFHSVISVEYFVLATESGALWKSQQMYSFDSSIKMNKAFKDCHSFLCD